ncbi:hypothetical protein [Paraburkholderia antibiotica]|uniref:Uncharacterized protein n=1 Tax=Paraburkholderia antibiotica TaxID=2728839 RepID=A0A7X9X2D7_9BURK|nr:hypothetical protein [Paraburkholderia antibiotica]NML29787.1 hypothetical protein [Paraburkholderia antibiotica]
MYRFTHRFTHLTPPLIALIPALVTLPAALIHSRSGRLLRRHFRRMPRLPTLRSPAVVLNSTAAIAPRLLRRGLSLGRRRSSNSISRNRSRHNLRNIRRLPSLPADIGVLRRAARQRSIGAARKHEVVFQVGQLRGQRRGRPLARCARRVGLGALRRVAGRGAGVRLIGGRRRFLVRPSGTFGYIRHGGAL